MNQVKIGKFIAECRRGKNLTQMQLAEKMNVTDRAVSKWETGNGFPDVSMLSKLAELLGTNEKSLLAGCIVENKAETGNIRRTKFYVCPHCGSSMQGLGDCLISCCGKILEPLAVKVLDETHTPTITEIENDFYVEFPHEMSKTHSLRFVTYMGFDRILTIRLYPEQDCAVRIPKAYGGKLVYYCNQHGLFEYPIKPRKKNT